MRSMILAQVRHRRGRSVALLLSVLAATTGFTVLTGTAQAARLQVVGSVSEHFRGAYDIVVRPSGSRSELENQRGLVEPNFVGGIHGGISLSEWQQVAALSGVEVAAPVAMLGYTRALYSTSFDITDLVDPSLDSQLIRIKPVWYGDGHLSRVEGEVAGTLYVTRNPIVWPVPDDPAAQTIVYSGRYSDGRTRPLACSGDFPPLELLPDGREASICLSGGATAGGADAQVIRLTAQGFDNHGVVTPHLTVTTYGFVAVQTAAVDPSAEAALVGLDDAVSWGSGLAPRGPITVDSLPPFATDDRLTFPGLLVDDPAVEESVTISAQRVAADIRSAPPDDVARIVTTAASVATVQPPEVSVAGAWRATVDSGSDFIGSQNSNYVDLSQAAQPGPLSFDVAADGTLTPRSPSADSDYRGIFFDQPFLDQPVRPVDVHEAVPVRPYTYAGVTIVGGYDVSLLRGLDPLAGAPLDTYAPDRATVAGSGLQFGPTSDPAGYLLTPPSVLISVWGLPWLDSTDTAPISAIRVRVAGVTAFDDLGRERVRLVAEQIASMGLDVDIVMGASGTLQSVALPAGSHGRPALVVDQVWTRKGVAAAIIEAVDRKSVVLFGLILVVCALALGNAVTAAVRSRAAELAILSCLGWSRRRLASLVLGEVLLLGLVAGLSSAVLAAPLCLLLGVTVSIWRLALAIPVALLLCVLATLLPVLRASRVHPAAALRPTVAPSRRWVRSAPSTFGVSLTGLTRVPGRSLVAVAALAVGVAGLMLLVAVTWVFHGSIIGTMLGDAVSVQVRGVDIVAVVATVCFGLFSVADVVYLGIRERVAEHAVLRAVGWSDAAIVRLVVFEGLALGILGSLTGAGLGLLAAAVFAGSVPLRLAFAGAATVAAAVALTALAALVPAVLASRATAATAATLADA